VKSIAIAVLLAACGDNITPTPPRPDAAVDAAITIAHPPVDANSSPDAGCGDHDGEGHHHHHH
jgi:hypothetical protein